jgi:hypothetical protein
MPIRPILAALALCLALPALAAQPNILPGQWEYTNVTRFENMPIPEQTHTGTECVTRSDIESGEAFVDDAENCEVTNKDLRASGMTYSMVCREQGVEVHMDADIRFMGDRAEGTMDARMDGPMGPMRMHIELSGRRIGDC